jgi:hypothetical protein
MNFPRLAFAAIAAWLASMVIGFAVDILLLRDLFAEHAAVLRPANEVAELMPFGAGAMLLGFFVFAYAYAKGYEGGNGMQEGLRFGVVVGLMVVCFAMVWQYVTFPVSSRFLFVWVAGYILEFAAYGAIVGAIYRPGRHKAGF